MVSTPSIEYRYATGNRIKFLKMMQPINADYDVVAEAEAILASASLVTV